MRYHDCRNFPISLGKESPQRDGTAAQCDLRTSTVILNDLAQQTGGDMPAVRDTPRPVGAWLEWTVAKLSENTFAAFGASAGIVAFLHWVQSFGLSSRNGFLVALPVALAAIVATACWALLLRLFWQTLRDPNQSTYIRAAVLSAVMICVSLEAFAELSTLLWQHGLIQPTTSGPASLWRTEGHYLWNLANSVPLLSAPRTLDWRDPQPFVDHISGALLLTFKFAIIAPLIRLGFSGYQFFEEQRGRAVLKREIRREEALAEKAEKGSSKEGEMPPNLRSDIEGWPLVWLAIALIIALPTVILPDTASRMDHWLARLPPEVSIGNTNFPLGWLHTTPQVLIAVGLIVTIANAMVSLSGGVNPDSVRSMRDVAVASLTYFLLLALITLAAAAISLVLIHLDAAISLPEIPPANQSMAAVNAYPWAIADSLPGPNIPATLNWTLQYRFVDHWSEVLLFTYKIVFYAVLLFPMYRIIRMYVERSRRKDPVESSLSAALKYRDRLLDVQAAMDRLEGRNVTRTPQKQVGSSPYPAQAELNDLESQLEKVRSLFGDTDVIRCAKNAERAARDRFDHFTMRSYGRKSANPNNLRLIFNAAIMEYSRSVSRELYNEGDKQFYRTEKL
jgi:hypothetical protein